MKRISLIIAAMIISTGIITGCSDGSNSTDTTEKPTTTQQTTSPSTTEAPEENKSLEGSLSDIIDKIYAEKDSGLRLMTSDIEISNVDSLKYFTGLDSSDKIKEAAASEAMIGSQAYSLVLVRLNDSKDSKNVAEAMKSGIDTRKWICVGADDLKVATYGDIAMLIMVDTQLSDTITADQIVEAFKTVCGGTLDS